LEEERLPGTRQIEDSAGLCLSRKGANGFAAEAMTPAADLKSLLNQQSFIEISIKGFADTLSISPRSWDEVERMKNSDMRSIIPNSPLFFSPQGTQTGGYDSAFSPAKS
jgi:hypothetical protein